MCKIHCHCNCPRADAACRSGWGCASARDYCGTALSGAAPACMEPSSQCAIALSSHGPEGALSIACRPGPGVRFCLPPLWHSHLLQGSGGAGCFGAPLQQAAAEAREEEEEAKEQEDGGVIAKGELQLYLAATDETLLRLNSVVCERSSDSSCIPARGRSSPSALRER